MRLDWNEIYNIGHKEIDEQHQKLFEILNDLNDARENGNGQNMLESIFKRLVDYTVYHFSMEENIMNEINYPKVEEHSNAHEEFISKIYHCEHNSETGNLLTSISLLDYLKRWIISHILGEDKEFGEYLKTVRKNDVLSFENLDYKQLQN